MTLPLVHNLPASEALRQQARRDRKVKALGAKKAAASVPLGLLGQLLALLAAMGLFKGRADALKVTRQLRHAKRPDLVPYVMDAAKAGEDAKARYWLRRAMGLQG